MEHDTFQFIWNLLGEIPEYSFNVLGKDVVFIFSRDAKCARVEREKAAGLPASTKPYTTDNNHKKMKQSHTLIFIARVTR